MKSTEQILDYIADRVGRIYLRPLMYGGSPIGVDLILYYNHELWSEILESQDDFRAFFEKVLHDEKCGASNFSTRFKEKHPDATDEEIANFVVAQWIKISKFIFRERAP